MIRICKPPRRAKRADNNIFLAGSIEMGKATLWQDKVIEMINEAVPENYHEDFAIFNPRRDDWDSTWEQSVDNANFYNQVNWEWGNLVNASMVIFYFEPGTISPVTMLEFGRMLYDTDDIVVVCPKGFHRKGNIDIVCEIEGVEQVETLEQAVDFIKARYSPDWKKSKK